MESRPPVLSASDTARSGGRGLEVVNLRIRILELLDARGARAAVVPSRLLGDGCVGGSARDRLDELGLRPVPDD